jgi:hypothetical protein
MLLEKAETRKIATKTIQIRAFFFIIFYPLDSFSRISGEIPIRYGLSINSRCSIVNKQLLFSKKQLNLASTYASGLFSEK